MTKTNDATRKRPTHFEQIPLEVVKKIAEEDVRNDKNNAGVQPTATKRKTQSAPTSSLH
jgi:hypothetical protein